MKNTKILFLIGAICVAIGQMPSYAKTWTVAERQARQMQDINAGQKSGQLTPKQADKLRGKLAQVARSKAKLRSKQNGKLSADKTASLQTGLNKVSSDISRTKQVK